ncbi:AMP-binding protein [Phenylobacterium sp.]|uniref:AMP-binding protein n=1 Tax=Phenylobacterium sp. TaxID=1871053 RepID=UPI00122BDA66|nr:AMP-binding protein [Phenylobacterium sp.]THD51082.1 MAG: AMP-dependent synthetase [Phenylobacterium sp.]
MSRVLNALRRHDPLRAALSDDAQSLTYEELAAEVDRLAGALAPQLAGLGADIPVAVDLNNNLAWVIVDLALIQLRRPSLPIPGFFTAEQRAHALLDAGAGALIASDGDGELVAAGRRLGLLDLTPQAGSLHRETAKVTYTSGSTGTPRGVCLSLAQMEEVAASLVEVIGADYAGVHLPILPLSILLENVAGLYATLLAGGRYHLAEAADLGLAEPFRPDLGRMVQTIAATGATSLILVPELLRGLVMAMTFTGAELPALNLVAVGGAKVSPELLAKAEAVGLPVYEGYGLSECASVVALNTPASRKVGAVGRVLPHLDVSLGEDREIVVGPRPFLGYAGGAPNLGPVHTGDLGWMDAEGFLHIDGRRSNTIITAFGRNVAPEWVESELLAQPAIRQAVVFGEAQSGIGALIVPLSADLPKTVIAEAVAHANSALPLYAQVVRWRLCPPFDRAAGELTGNGRPRREVILERHRDFTNPATQDPPVTFFPRLVTETLGGQQVLASVPQIEDGLAGRISLETYIAYLTEAYHHVKHTVPLMQTAKARLDDRHTRFRDALDEYIAEETGHEEWILNDIRHAGGDADAVRHGQPRAATRAMVDFVYDFIARDNAMGFFGMVLVLEGTSVRLATQGADAVAASLGLGPECFSYLSSHGAVDQEHLVSFQKLMDEVDDPDDQRAIIAVASAVFDLFADVFRAIPHDRSLAHAV